MKKAALINDISGLGKCSLTADLSVLTVMGVEAVPFPTAVLNAQTGFSGYVCRDMTDLMRSYTDGWRRLVIHFDGILTGFLLNAEQAGEVLYFTERFYESGTVLLVDPVLADQGKHYANYHDELLERMKELAAMADILTPNISELCLLTEADMGEVLALSGKYLENSLTELAGKLLNKTGKTVIVTGIPAEDCDDSRKADCHPGTKGNESRLNQFVENNGKKMIGNLVIDNSKAEMISFPVTGGSYSGTGDLFAAAVLGGILNGVSMIEAVKTAGEFVMHSVADAQARGADANAGTDYERNLQMLLPAGSEKRG